jgi:hypothetical protein
MELLYIYYIYEQKGQEGATRVATLSGCAHGCPYQLGIAQGGA